jgi:creatinase/prolidase-like protein
VKRGLAVLDPAEIPADEWAARVRTLRERIAADGVDVAFVYGDVHRSDDIGYLTNLCIYWNEGVVAVPVDADPVFLTKLSPRVHGWMRRTSMVSELRSGRSFGALAKDVLGDRAPAVLGLVDARRWPAAVVDELRAALPGWELRLLGDLVRRQRLVPSAHELALLRDGARIAGRAAARARGPGLPVPARVALVERELRGGGFADVFVGAGVTGDGVVSIEITGQYRHGWLRTAGLVTPEGAPADRRRPHDHGAPADPSWVHAVRAALWAAVDAAVAGGPVAQLAAATAPALAGLPTGAAADVGWVNQADLSTSGEYERHARGTRLPAGAVGAITVEVLFADGGRGVVADTVLVTADGARRLTTWEG